MENLHKNKISWKVYIPIACGAMTCTKPAENNTKKTGNAHHAKNCNAIL